MPSVEECKKIISKVGFKLGASPRLILTRLLSDHDKVDMLAGDLTIASLEAHTEVWRDSGMIDCAHGKSETYEAEKNRVKQKNMIEEKLKTNGVIYAKPFAEWPETDNKIIWRIRD